MGMKMGMRTVLAWDRPTYPGGGNLLLAAGLFRRVRPPARAAEILVDFSREGTVSVLVEL